MSSRREYRVWEPNEEQVGVLPVYRPGTLAAGHPHPRFRVSCRIGRPAEAPQGFRRTPPPFALRPSVTASGSMVWGLGRR
jgi:hypothetical protein